MTRSVLVVALPLAALLLGGLSQVAPASAGELSQPAPHQVKQAPPPPHDPNKKNDGDACKAADECQPHHSCEKVGDQQVCKAPPPRRLPPGAVT